MNVIWGASRISYDLDCWKSTSTSTGTSAHIAVSAHQLEEEVLGAFFLLFFLFLLTPRRATGRRRHGEQRAELQARCFLCSVRLFASCYSSSFLLSSRARAVRKKSMRASTNAAPRSGAPSEGTLPRSGHRAATDRP